MPVEPIAILTTVLATARAVHYWLKDKDRKQNIIEDLTKVMQTLCDILQPLQELDVVAYLRFASVYQDFDSLEDFESAIARLRSEGQGGAPAPQDSTV